MIIQEFKKGKIGFEAAKKIQLGVRAQKILPKLKKDPEKVCFHSMFN